MDLYGHRFYSRQMEDSLGSAREILPLILDLVKPNSIIDVGCGTGVWLSVCRQLGVKDVMGVDGNWVEKSWLLFPEKHFISADLKIPLRINRTFDLTMSMEVAEHIPKKSEQSFIDSLVRLGPVILFSADVPHQGGIGHVNERWQDHWARLFQERQYAVIDCVRPEIWNNRNVMWWYAQNTLLYVRQDYLDTHVELKKMFQSSKGLPLRIVHPSLFEGVTDPRKMSLKKALMAIPFGITRLIKRILGKSSIWSRNATMHQRGTNIDSDANRFRKPKN